MLSEPLEVVSAVAADDVVHGIEARGVYGSVDPVDDERAIVAPPPAGGGLAPGPCPARNDRADGLQQRPAAHCSLCSATLIQQSRASRQRCRWPWWGRNAGGGSRDRYGDPLALMRHVTIAAASSRCVLQRSELRFTENLYAFPMQVAIGVRCVGLPDFMSAVFADPLTWRGRLPFRSTSSISVFALEHGCRRSDDFPKVTAGRPTKKGERCAQSRDARLLLRCETRPLTLIRSSAFARPECAIQVLLIRRYCSCRTSQRFVGSCEGDGSLP